MKKVSTAAAKQSKKISETCSPPMPFSVGFASWSTPVGRTWLTIGMQ